MLKSSLEKRGRGARAALFTFLMTAPLLAGCDRETLLLSNAHFSMENPASAYCIKKGGGIESVRNNDGVYGLCHLPDGRIVDEWKLFRQDHPAPTGQSTATSAQTPATPAK